MQPWWQQPIPTPEFNVEYDSVNYSQESTDWGEWLVD